MVTEGTAAPKIVWKTPLELKKDDTIVRKNEHGEERRFRVVKPPQKRALDTEFYGVPCVNERGIFQSLTFSPLERVPVLS